MTPPLVITTSSGFWKRIVGLYVICGLIVGLVVAQQLHNPGKDSWIWWVFSAVVLTLPLWLVLPRRWWVARFDERGVTLRSGRLFPWSDFETVKPRHHNRLRIVNHYDLVFRGGRAAVFHRMAENQLEVEELLKKLATGLNPYV